MQSIDLIGATLELYLTVVEDAWKKSKILYEDLGIEKCFNFKKTIFQNSLMPLIIKQKQKDLEIHSYLEVY